MARRSTACTYADLGETEYSVGQSFVALSRVRNIESMVIKSFAMHRDRLTRVFRHDRYKKVKSQYARLEALSENRRL